MRGGDGKAGMVVEIKCPEFDAFEKEMGEEDGAFEEIERLTSGTAATSTSGAGFNSQMRRRHVAGFNATSRGNDERHVARNNGNDDVHGCRYARRRGSGMVCLPDMSKCNRKWATEDATMAEMMSKVNPEQIKQMSKAAGMNMSDEQAEHAAKTLKNVKPGQMEKFMKVAFGSKFYGRFRSKSIG